MGANDPSPHVRSRSFEAIAFDTDLDPATKTFALCLQAWLATPATERPPSKVDSTTEAAGSEWVGQVGQMMLGNSAPGRLPGPYHPTTLYHAIKTVRRAIARDMPRYEPPLPAKIACPHITTHGRRAGQPCGQTPSDAWLDRDPQTGEGHYIGYCPEHLTPERQHQHTQAQRGWENNGRPTPPTNTGGILPRYFAADWPQLYEWAEPRRQPQPQAKISTPPLAQRPVLSLIRGGPES